MNASSADCLLHPARRVALLGTVLVGVTLAPVDLFASSRAVATLVASAAEPVDLWPEGKMPGRGASDPEALRTPERTDARRITNVSRPTLTLFPAPGKNRAAPAVIVCPGGGYGYVVVDKEGSDIAAWLNTNGISALVLKYRVPNNRDGALQDLQRALRLTRARAAEWNMDPTRLGVMGFSAGGNLAAKASTRFAEPAYTPLDAVDQQSCRPDFAVLVYPAYLDDKNGGVSPELTLGAGIPPTLIVHTEDDRSYVAGSKIYHAALEAAHVTNEFRLYANGGHGYALRSTNEARVWPQDCMRWLETVRVLPNQSAAASGTAPVRIAIIGDSTVCEYPLSRPDRGWGQFIQEYFRAGAVTVTNLAASGRSTKTFIQEGRWQKTLEQKPDYILIQFGHNDSHSLDKPESTGAATDYRDYLRRYINEARAGGATPILVTPMVRRKFGPDGKLENELQPYADAMRAVGKENKVPVVDLHRLSKRLVEQLGPDESAAFANKPGDATHFNEKGARAMADLVMNELPIVEPQFKGLVKKP